MLPDIEQWLERLFDFPVIGRSQHHCFHVSAPVIFGFAHCHTLQRLTFYTPVGHRVLFVIQSLAAVY
jgi:hypothetical protein